MTTILDVACGGTLIAALFAARGRPLFWPLLGLSLLLLANWLWTPGFADLELRDGRLYGMRVDILTQGSKIIVLAVGMSLVIALGGVDLSVGAVMAISGAVAAQAAAAGWSDGAGIAFALGAALLAGAANGALVSNLGVQPIIATLVLMVAGRGIAQLVCGGQIVELRNGTLNSVGTGAFAGLPLLLWVAVAVALVVGCLMRRTAWGLYFEAVGDGAAASRISGVPVRVVTFAAYLASALCAGIAGLLAAANIRCADANHSGLNLELDAILAVVVGGSSLAGGRFSIAGGVIGALLIQTLSTTLFARDVSAELAPVPKALVIIVLCLVQSEKLRSALWKRLRPAS
jgi:galactofuranose transport system permease protein